MVPWNDANPWIRGVLGCYIPTYEPVCVRCKWLGNRNHRLDTSKVSKSAVPFDSYESKISASRPPVAYVPIMAALQTCACNRHATLRKIVAITAQEGWWELAVGLQKGKVGEIIGIIRDKPSTVETRDDGRLLPVGVANTMR
ncbi:uncharacterized protein CLUP02_17709 [Colletotrichum lupini]|uniref:Uncharacterized protein n=1 Tax=Colletotrichum lupini TaxID=145971 RepID=A0A9Q8SFY0_9PEZI|nr:uncharacterized protein CLUP02_17709 [Colletotrichum lupini]UQC76196.1 hypothetical protein CLUP02_17709 [Colletotrichum lupini]